MKIDRILKAYSRGGKRRTITIHSKYIKQNLHEANETTESMSAFHFMSLDKVTSNFGTDDTFRKQSSFEKK